MAAPELIQDLVSRFEENRLLYRSGNYNEARLRLEFVGWLREQRRFSSADELVAEIKCDILRTRELLP